MPQSGPDATRYVFAVKPRCPKCGGDKLATVRSTSQANGTRLQRKSCKSCGHSFYLVWE